MVSNVLANAFFRSAKCTLSNKTLFQINYVYFQAFHNRRKDRFRASFLCGLPSCGWSRTGWGWRPQCGRSSCRHGPKRGGRTGRLKINWNLITLYAQSHNQLSLYKCNTVRFSKDTRFVVIITTKVQQKSATSIDVVQYYSAREFLMVVLSR